MVGPLLHYTACCAELKLRTSNTQTRFTAETDRRSTLPIQQLVWRKAADVLLPFPFEVGVGGVRSRHVDAVTEIGARFSGGDLVL